MPDLCLSQSGPFGSCFAFQSLLDDQGLAEVSRVAEQVLDAINKRLYKEATELWGKAEMVIEQVRGDALGASLLGFSPWVKGPWLVLLGLGSIFQLFCVFENVCNKKLGGGILKCAFLIAGEMG